MEENHKNKIKKEMKKIILWSTIAGAVTAITTCSFTVVGVTKKQKEKKAVESLEKKGQELYAKYKYENQDGTLNSIYQFYQKAATTICEENLAVITPGQNGYLAINEDGIFKWVSFDGNLYDSPKELLDRIILQEVQEENKKEAIENIMGLETKTNFSLQDYRLLKSDFTLISEVKEGNLYQDIYQRNKDTLEVKKVGEGKLYQTPYGYQSIYTSKDGMIKADNLLAFAILEENKDLYIAQQTQNKINEAKAK